MKWLIVTCSQKRTSRFANKCQYPPCKFSCIYPFLQLQCAFKAQRFLSVCCSFFQLSSWHLDFPLAFAVNFPSLSKLDRWSEFTCVRHSFQHNYISQRYPYSQLERTEIVRAREYL